MWTNMIDPLRRLKKWIFLEDYLAYFYALVAVICFAVLNYSTRMNSCSEREHSLTLLEH